MEAICPHCRARVPLDDINVSTDLALCRACGRSLRYSDLVPEPPSASFDLNAPPSGAWFERLPSGFRTGATTRSWMALFFVPFTCAWSGASMWGIYGQQFLKGEFNLMESIFGLPFLVGTILLLALCAMSVAGRTEITKTSDRLLVFTGVGPIGITHTYSWSEFSFVRENAFPGNLSFNFNFGQRGQGLALEGKRRITFGSMWSAGRRFFVLQVLRTMLRESGQS